MLITGSTEYCEDNVFEKLKESNLKNTSYIPEPIVKEDLVNHPKHYQTKSGLETIDVIEAFTDGLNGIEAVCTGNAIKYLCRWKKKNGKEDLEKARWYIDYYITLSELEI